MKKIGIVTINDNNNYGNRLQNYALQKVLLDLDFNVITLRNKVKNQEKKVGEISTRLKSASLNEMIKKIITKILRKINIDKNLRKVSNERRKKFQDFNKEYILESEEIIYEGNIPSQIIEEFDFFIAGSDQIWNPNFRKGSGIDFLDFAPKQKRISYAASFGIESIPEEYKKKYTSWLNGMNHISVREDAGAKIVRTLSDKHAAVHVDPTLLVSKENWLDVSRKSVNKPQKKYLLTYFLKGMSTEQQNLINKISKENKLVVVNLAKKDNLEFFSAGPSEFLDFINSCEIFLTNSFHGVIFSLIFEKPFIVFERGNMNSRIDTLLKKFSLEDRKIENIDLTKNIFQIDFTPVSKLISKEKEVSIKYLKNVLKFNRN